MKKLIITADDFGLSESINDGIIDCYNNKDITDISIMAFSEKFEHAVRLAQKNNITNIGAHISLCSKNDFNKQIDRFPWKFIFDREEVEKTIRIQLTRIKNENFNITHLNSHQHVHMIPWLRESFAKIAEEFNVSYLRVPNEYFAPSLYSIKTWPRVLALGSITTLSNVLFSGSKVKTNDYFFGHCCSGNMTEHCLKTFCTIIKNGVTELACHPGYLSDDVKNNFSWHINCENELKALKNSTFKEALKKNNISLTSYCK